MTSGNSEWRTTGDTDRSSFVQALSRAWTAGSSPMAKEAGAVWDALRPFGLTRLGAAMCWHETKNWSWNGDTAPAGQPAIPAACRNPWAMKAEGGEGWARYASFAEAAAAWGDRLMSPNGPYARTGTVRELIDVYAPSWDGNDTGRYVETVCREIDALPLVEDEEMPPSSNPFPRPKVTDLAETYPSWGLTRAQADKVRSHRFVDRRGYKVRALVCHIQEGASTAGSLQWWASGNADASATVMVQKDGSVLRVIPEADGPWTNGDVQSPSAKGQRLVDRLGGANVNLATLSIEAEGYAQDAMPAVQVQAICWQLTDWMMRYGLEVADIYKHADFNSVTRPNCPGRYWDVVMAELQKGATPDPAPAAAWPGKPAWMPDWLVTVQFPEANPDPVRGTRTQAWFRYCAEVGRAPARKAFLKAGTPDELVLLDDGALIGLDGKVLR